MDTLGTMTAGIAHELTNLITIVMGSIEMAAVEPLSARQAERLERANWAACAAGRLTHQIVSFAKSAILDAGSVDLNGLIGEFDQVLTQVATSDLSVDFDFAGEPLLAKVDVVQVKLALINLVRNATDASTKGGRISVKTQSLAAGDCLNPLGEAAAVEIAVADTGTGMPPEVAARATEPFFTTKQPGKGTGLGLSIVHRFIQQSGGKMLIESEEGRGTTIRLAFPRRE